MRYSALFAVVAVVGAAACSATPATSNSTPAASAAVQPAPPAGSAPAGAAPVGEPAAAVPQATAPAAGAAAASAPPAAAPGAGPVTGSVIETMNSGGYTYARLKVGQKDVWIAVTEMAVKKGDRLTVALEMPMQNFRSKSLNRDFPLIYFVAGVAREGEKLPAAGVAGGMPAMASSHGSGPAPSAAAAGPVEPVAPAPGGISIADLWAKTKSLGGTTVIVRGKVVKVNNGIMDRNWIHLQDGSGSAEKRTNDLTVTTKAELKVGDIVTLSGILEIDKDFGSGYAYAAILEKATVTGK